jgi:hypothetical protein
MSYEGYGRCCEEGLQGVGANATGRISQDARRLLAQRLFAMPMRVTTTRSIQAQASAGLGCPSRMRGAHLNLKPLCLCLYLYPL